MREQQGIFANIDRLLIVVYLVLVICGWLSIYAAVYDESYKSIFDLNRDYGRQAMFIAVSIVVAFVIILLDAKIFSSFAWLFYIFAMLVLVGVLIFGITVSGAQSWFKIGPFSVQPAEFAKTATALALAKFLCAGQLATGKFRPLFFAMGIILFPMALIILQNDTGTALVYLALFLVLYREGMSGWVIMLPVIGAVLFVLTLLIGEWWTIAVWGGVLLIIWGFFVHPKIKYIKHLVLVFVCGAGMVFCCNIAFEHILSDHQQTRINVLLGIEKDQQKAGYNVHQSLIAIGSGGFSGKGFLKGTQTKYNFVPEQNTDFIFCTVGEEWGFVGCTFIIGLYVLLIWRIIRNAERQRSAFARIYGYGVASIFLFHFVINVGMVLGLLPVIGIPLPFLSYGGSSLLSFTILLFIFIKQDANRLNLL